MPIVSPQAVASVASRVLALSPETNPYSWLQHTLRDEFVPQLSSKPYQILLWVAVGLHSIAMLCHMATLYFRARSKALWLFHRNPAGHIVPNVACVFACGGIFYCALAIATHAQLSLYMLPKLRDNLIIWPLMSLLCLTLSAWVEVWSTAVTAITVDDSSQHIKKRKRFVSPRLFNTLFIGLPIVYISVALALIVPLTLADNKVTDSIRDTLAQLDAAGVTWTYGKVSLSVLQQLSREMANSESMYDAMFRWERVVVNYELIVNSTLLLVWFPLLVFTVRQLRSQIRFMLQQKSIAPRNSTIVDDAFRMKLEHLISACRQRILNASVGYVMGLSYVGVCLVPVIAGSEALTTEPAVMQAFLIGGAFIYSIFGTPVSFVLCYVSYKASKKSKGSTGLFSLGSASSGSHHRLEHPAGLPANHVHQDIELSAKANSVRKEFDEEP